jgi:succinoglycan biosynthesis transport protein ExoP
VLLIDGDLRNPGLTYKLGRHATKGILEALQDDAPLSELVITNPETGLTFLPAIVTRRIPYSSELLASPAMDRILSEASSDYDYIIIDLPPLAPLVDAKAISSKIHACIMVVEWGKTPRNVVKKVLRANALIMTKCVGVILNKVDLTKMKFYDGFGATQYYAQHYHSYFKE